MDIETLEKLESEFNALADSTRVCLQGMQDTLAEQRVPSKETLDNFRSLFASLEEKYKSIFDTAQEYHQDCSIEYGISISKYFEMIKEKISGITNIKNILEQFIKVKSDEYEYMEVLKKFQDEIKGLLENFKDINNEEEIIQKSEAPKIFLQALDIEDIDADEHDELLDKIEKFYGRKIEKGLRRKKYYIEESDTSRNIILYNNIGIDISRKKTIKLLKKPYNLKVFKMLEYFGILTESQIHEFISLNNNEDDQRKILCAIKDLASDGLLAEYLMKSDNSEIFIYALLTQYIDKKIISEVDTRKMVWFHEIIDIRNKIIDKNNLILEEEKFRDVILENEIVIRYLCGIQKIYSAEQCKTVIDYIWRWKGSYYLFVFLGEEKIHCQVFRKNLIIEDEGSAGILVIEQNCPEELRYSKRRVFVYQDGEIQEIKNPTDQKQDDIDGTEQDDIDGTEQNDIDAAEQDDIDGTEQGDANGAEQHEAAGAEQNDTDATEQGDIDDTKQSDDEGPERDGGAERVDTDTDGPEQVPGLRERLEKVVNGQNIPSDQDFCSLAVSLLDDKTLEKRTDFSNIIQALLLLKAASTIDNNSNCQKFYEMLKLSTNIPIEQDRCNYASERLVEIFEECDEKTAILKFTSYMHALLVPARKHDHMLISQAKTLLNTANNFSFLKKTKLLFNKMLEIPEVLPTGFSRSILELIENSKGYDESLKKLQKKAQDLLTLPNLNPKIKSLPILFRHCFGTRSDLYYCMEIISGSKIDEFEYVISILEDYCDVHDDSYIINDVKINEILDKEWSIIQEREKKFRLGYDAREKTIRNFYIRLEIMRSWIEYLGSEEYKGNIEQYKILKKEIIGLIDESIGEVESTDICGKSILLFVLNNIKNYLYLEKNSDIKKDVFRELFFPGILSFDENGIPVMHKEFNQLEGFEPWRNVVRHILTPIYTQEEIKKMIFEDRESYISDNLNQYNLIEMFINDHEYSTISEDNIKAACKSADIDIKQFEEILELDYTYGRIDEIEKENLLGLLSNKKDVFYELKDFGIFGQFVQMLKNKLKNISDERKTILERQIAELREIEGNKASSTLSNAAAMVDRGYFSVAEDYISKFLSGEKDITLSLQYEEPDIFKEFFSGDLFEQIYDICRRNPGSPLNSFGWRFIESIIKSRPDYWTSRNKDESKVLIESWPPRMRGTSVESMTMLFNSLGFNQVIEAKKINTNIRNVERYQITVLPSDRSLADYSHPISKFGTQINQPFDVIIFYGNPRPSEIIDIINKLNSGNISIVLVDRHITIAERRQLCEDFHRNSGKNPFIVIDRILLLYLSLREKSARLPVLLKCTLPFTTYQPFLREVGTTDDEMFFGRIRELSTIIDGKGACIVYGGRQLGKTALLRRVQSLCNKPNLQKIAIYCDIYKCKKEIEVVSRICEESQKNNLDLGNCQTIQDICHSIVLNFRDKTIKSMILLLDESDDFLETISHDDYAPLKDLVKLKKDNEIDFNFVIAGLHNVCRVKNSTEYNGIFGQLGTPLCIKPLSPTDATELLLKPLTYLGFRVDNYIHLQTILTNTNYYPGILQFFGYMIVEVLQNKNKFSQNYSAAKKNPPFPLHDELLGQIINSTDLNNSIKDKFLLTLKLDPRYFMLARCIAILYFINDNDIGALTGFSVNDIMDISKDWILCLKNEGYGDIKNLLDELVDMGILSKLHEKYYRFRRRTFLNLVGTDLDAVELEIENNNSERNNE